MATTISARTLAGTGRRFLELAGGYWSGEHRWKSRLLTIAVVALTVCQVIVPVLINLWSEQLFDALEQRSMDRFMTMIAAVLVIIAMNAAVTVLHLRVKRRLQLGWRLWLTRRLLDGWVIQGRQHQVTYLPGEHDNPDGRIAEDIRIATEYAVDLALSLTYCVLLLVSFINILWMLSGAPEVTLWDGFTVTVPGYLVYVALLYAAAGTTIAMVIGKPMVRAANRRQAYEADFRFGLARVRENAQSIALLHGEAAERHNLFSLFDGLRRGWHGQTRALSDMMLFSAAYSVLSMAFPVLVVAPRYIAGTISLGVLMQTVQAFQQTVAALSWPIDNLPRVAEWRASVERVLGLHDALEQLAHDLDGTDARIVVDRSDAETQLSFQGLCIRDPDGRTVIEPFDSEILPGERVLIVGDPGAAIRLFRAVARVWPWGSGRIALPAHTRVFFMPQRPYLARGTLRAALSYPGEPHQITDEAALAALTRVDLPHLYDRLDVSEPWDQVLAMSEQQRLGFARLLLRRPDWIFLEDATDALSPEAEEDMLRLLDQEFPKATLITIGSRPGLESHHRRKLMLERTNGSVHVKDEPITEADLHEAVLAIAYGDRNRRPVSMGPVTLGGSPNVR